ncbi:hypothetical protein ACJMK2_006456 [Sinanodonta woodiana]|uniref:Uncharacterized protein n=1 Tax=Sinanodonta woodiana TaxID=1069815 RepID=A0ABD3VWF1_SINWO
MLMEIGQFTGDFLDISLIQFFFLMDLPTKNQNSPKGRHVVMYKLPVIYGTRSYLQSVDEYKIEICRDECVFQDEYPCDIDRWTSPTNIDNALQLYCDIRNGLMWICDDKGFTSTVILS